MSRAITRAEGAMPKVMLTTRTSAEEGCGVRTVTDGGPADAGGA